jgi:hypothetical protein
MGKLIRFLEIIFSLFTAAMFWSCDSSQRIVDKAIAAHGGDRFERVKIEFDFRGRHYTSTRNKGTFSYTREFSDSTGDIKDVLTNNSFRREINGGIAKIPEERAKAFSNSVNSVIYFALLPFGLNDPAVKKTYVGETMLRNKEYHVIRITFDQQGGGKDYEDVFLFWIQKESFRVDYFAYSYKSDGGGIRFRVAVNPRIIEGILFQDYNNFKPKEDSVTLDQMQEMYEQNQLEKMSLIKLENIKVKQI